ncbi:MAG: hypothetical protein ACLQBL_08245 [Polyangiaceae bacterium]
MRTACIGAPALALVHVLAPAVARAQTESLRQEADRVAEEWRKGGALIGRGPSRFLYDNDTMTITLPPAESSAQPCTTVAILGGRGVSFHAKVAGVEDDPIADDPSARAASVAGVLEIGGCGDAAGPLERLRVTSDAGRGAIETIVARSARPPAAIRTVLPERTGGMLPPPPDAGFPPPLSPPEKRADLAELRAVRDGAGRLPRASWTAAGDGSGDVKLSLEGGCHRIEIFAADTRAARLSRRRRLDVDAEIRDSDEDLLARDRTDNADARLELCVGETTNATVIFAGAPADNTVTVTHAWWPIPPHLPLLWGPEPRARMAHALLARKADAPTEEAVALYGGLAGATAVPVPLEPGACYLAVAAVTNGHARGLGLRATVGAQEARDERTSDDDAGVVAFCARDHRLARLEVEARGASITWGLALYRLEGRAWEGR